MLYILTGTKCNGVLTLWRPLGRAVLGFTARVRAVSCKSLCIVFLYAQGKISEIARRD